MIVGEAANILLLIVLYIQQLQCSAHSMLFSAFKTVTPLTRNVTVTYDRVMGPNFAEMKDQVSKVSYAIMIIGHKGIF